MASWRGPSRPRPPTRSFHSPSRCSSGASGSGCGVPGRSPRAGRGRVAVRGRAALLRRRVRRRPRPHRPDRRERPAARGQRAFSSSAVRDPANATRVPMGIEFLGPGNPPRSAEIPATGRTLREVLDAMVAIDPRYEWREMDQAYVIRPTASWNDPQSLLFRLVPENGWTTSRRRRRSSGSRGSWVTTTGSMGSPAASCSQSTRRKGRSSISPTPSCGRTAR